jgi:serine/threonine-protein kinase
VSGSDNELWRAAPASGPSLEPGASVPLASLSSSSDSHLRTGSNPERELAHAEAELTAEWDVRGIDIATLAVEDGTLVRIPAGTSAPDLGVLDERALPRLLCPSEDEAPAQLVLRAVIATGGMGVVQAAEQSALGREVAVKTLRKDATPSAALRLLREARIMGLLEHPNIVPVHAIGRDDRDQPMIVMKRIDGVSWEALLERADDVERADEGYLRRHLEVLMQVARAAHYAHSKGIVHRDIKPANVMIGSFDEVYLVDWGVAVSMCAPSVAGIPEAGKVTTIEGSPAYMAPEMAAGAGDAIDERTDVYLLGATLHHVLAGSPPHDGDTVRDTLVAAFASTPPPAPAHTPRELSVIARRAMSRQREQRFASAAALADALGAFLEHRSSVRLSDEAQARLGALKALAPEARAADEQRLRALYGLFSECRFGFEQALRSWSDNRRAARGLEEAIETMVEFELQRGATDAALTLLRELGGPRAELMARVERAADERARRAAVQAAEVRSHFDVRVGATARAWVTLMAAAVWTAIWLSIGAAERAGVEITLWHGALVNVAFGIAIPLAGTLLGGRALLASALNRKLLLVGSPLQFMGQGLAFFVVGSLGDSFAVGAAAIMLVAATALSAATVTLERSWLPLALTEVVGLIVLAFMPSHAFEVLAVVGGAGGVLSALWLFAGPGPTVDAALMGAVPSTRSEPAGKKARDDR